MADKELFKQNIGSSQLDDAPMREAITKAVEEPVVDAPLVKKTVLQKIMTVFTFIWEIIPHIRATIAKMKAKK